MDKNEKKFKLFGSPQKGSDVIQETKQWNKSWTRFIQFKFVSTYACCEKFKIIIHNCETALGKQILASPQLDEFLVVY